MSARARRLVHTAGRGAAARWQDVGRRESARSRGRPLAASVPAVPVMLGEAVEVLAGVLDREPDVVGGGLAEALEQRPLVAVAGVQDREGALGQLDEFGFGQRV